jgi:hypothetical protein
MAVLRWFAGAWVIDLQACIFRRILAVETGANSDAAKLSAPFRSCGGSVFGFPEKILKFDSVLTVALPRRILSASVLAPEDGI